MSFAPFIQGSRRCSFKVLSPRLHNLVAIHLLPIAHAAQPSFYDGTMSDLDAIRNAAQRGQDKNADLFTFDAANIYHQHHLAEINRSERDLLTTKRFVLVVEGAAETEAERQMETEEMSLIQRHVKMTMASQDLTAQGMPADMLQESATFVDRFKNAIDAGSLFSPAHEKSICDMYSLPYPLPHELVLQDSFFRPRLVFRHGDCIVNGDIIATQLQPNPSVAVSDPVSFHGQREVSCVQTIKQLVRECDDENITLLKDEHSDEHEKSIQRHIVVLWGHYHCPRLLKLLELSQKKDSSSGDDNDQFTMVKNDFGTKKNVVYEWSDEIRSYGWSKEMVKQFYGNMADEEEAELKKK